MELEACAISGRPTSLLPPQPCLYGRSTDARLQEHDDALRAQLERFRPHPPRFSRRP